MVVPTTNRISGPVTAFPMPNLIRSGRSTALSAFGGIISPVAVRTQSGFRAFKKAVRPLLRMVDVRPALLAQNETPAKAVATATRFQVFAKSGLAVPDGAPLMRFCDASIAPQILKA